MNAPRSHQRYSMIVSRFLSFAFLGIICGLTPHRGMLIAISMMCGTASAASPWFNGYLDPSNSYRYFAHTDWDTPLFGVGIQPDTDVFGIAAPAYRVDGHVVYEADGTGSATVIESTGSFATTPAYLVGSVHLIPSLFADPFFNPGFPPVTDTRGDYNANFLNIVSGPVPEPASLTILALGGVALLARRRR